MSDLGFVDNDAIDESSIFHILSIVVRFDFRVHLGRKLEMTRSFLDEKWESGETFDRKCRVYTRKFVGENLTRALLTGC